MNGIGYGGVAPKSRCVAPRLGKSGRRPTWANEGPIAKSSGPFSAYLIPRGGKVPDMPFVVSLSEASHDCDYLPVINAPKKKSRTMLNHIVPAWTKPRKSGSYHRFKHAGAWEYDVAT